MSRYCRDIPTGKHKRVASDDALNEDVYQSAHPLALFFLYFFRLAAILVYILCGWFTDNFVLSVRINACLAALGA